MSTDRHLLATNSMYRQFKLLTRTPLICAALLLFSVSSTAQISRNVLFLGNSYTASNNLPQLVADAAQSAGDTLVFDSNTPGGYRLVDHAGDPNSQNKIAAGGWDYVVMQGQSQEPITTNWQFTSGGNGIKHAMSQSAPCAVPLLYMTWGRKNGDASNCPTIPVMCTYLGMDSTLRNRYEDFGASLGGEVSPVSVVWRYLRDNHPTIELYSGDGSHPSLAGSYAAACCFYSAIFKKDPTLISFDAGVNAADAATIRNAAKVAAFDQLSMWDFQQPPAASFTVITSSDSNLVYFLPSGLADTYHWDFGDGDTSTLPYPNHVYATDGSFTVTLTTTNCNLEGVHTSISDSVLTFCPHTPGIFTTNGWVCQYDTLWADSADAYQWYTGATALPETNQFLADYAQYQAFGFSVATTLNGCTELSEDFSANPEWSGYYFDLVGGGHPCDDDSLPFAVLHTTGMLHGGEVIRWYKNGALLPQYNDEDTLWLATIGNFVCKVVNPLANCPTDTTRYEFTVDSCETTNIALPAANASFSLFPNPARESVTITAAEAHQITSIRVINALGAAANMQQPVYSRNRATVDVRSLKAGIYFVIVELDGVPQAQRIVVQ